jgi:PKHD-type hydroxylase
MLVDIPGVLDPDRLQAIRTALAERDDAWVDGRATAGHQGAQVKRNLQTNERNPVARHLGDMIVEALQRNSRFISAALPNRVYPPIFNRYEAGMHFGSHVDGAVRIVPSTGAKLRTDLSATLFISDPGSYDGGELLIEDTYGVHSAKRPAGHLIVYPATSLHRVTPVTRGTRLASVMWVQSLVRDDGQRALLFDLDNAIQRLDATQGDEIARTHLTGCYHNLLRMWTDV